MSLSFLLLQPKSTGQDVFNRVAELLGVKELYFFGLTVVRGKFPPRLPPSALLNLKGLFTLEYTQQHCRTAEHRDHTAGSFAGAIRGTEHVVNQSIQIANERIVFG